MNLHTCLPVLVTPEGVAVQESVSEDPETHLYAKSRGAGNLGKKSGEPYVSDPAHCLKTVKDSSKRR